MPNPYGVPEISVHEVARKQQSGDSFLLLDVREPYELASASLAGANVVLVPLSVLAQQQVAALPPEAQDKDAEIVVFCHHGVRSAQVVAWLRQQGWTQVLNLAGGIDAWAKEIDPTVGSY